MLWRERLFSARDDRLLFVVSVGDNLYITQIHNHSQIINDNRLYKRKHNMTAEEARIITRRAVIVRYTRSIDEMIYNAADRGEYSVEYTHKINGCVKEIGKFLLESLTEHYTKNGFTIELKNESKTILVIQWNETKEDGQPKTIQITEDNVNESFEHGDL